MGDGDAWPRIGAQMARWHPDYAAFAQFICSFAGSNMNVMINDMSHDLHTDVQGAQVCITFSCWSWRP